eukprot:GGOE01063385.1.p1 GENE.GGOE01063385.1~~GGOE01063385.1.p1  ORF type:complete len:1216 (+),score=365.53 GGOE01063385.1:87-3650(+)
MQHQRHFNAFERTHRFPSNGTKTKKYRWYTFFPVNLWEQFCKPMNLYYAFIVLVEVINSTSGIPGTLFPLVVLIFVNMAKDLYEDKRMADLDRELNDRETHVVDENGVVQKTAWKDVKVGSILIILEDEPVPADTLVLQSSEEHGVCYINTMQLDGEINLKSKHCIRETHEALTSLACSDQNISSTALQFLKSIAVECEEPNGDLSYFSGVIKSSAGEGECTNRDIIYRGCTLRNTPWILGIAVFTGKDLKLSRNVSLSRNQKQSRVQSQLNLYFIGCCSFLISMCFLAGTCFVIWAGMHPSLWYVKQYHTGGLGWIQLAIAYLSATSSMIPISLTVSIEVMKFLHAFYINNDLAMCWYCPERDTYICAAARSTNVIENLGQVQYIFSDKTGTLTENRMALMKCSIAGVPYGVGVTEVQRAQAMQTGTRIENPYPPDIVLKPGCTFYDPRINLGEWKVQPGARAIRDFFLHLAVCHTVITKELLERTGTEEDSDMGSVEEEVAYSASSPDEEAMVIAASSVGFCLRRRQANVVTVEVDGVPLDYTVMNINEFSSTRKRMSCVVQDPNGRLLLLCKGADDVIMERVAERTTVAEETGEHLRTFAQQGLRTLVLAQRHLSEDFYADWDARFRAAIKSHPDIRAQEMEAVADEVERGMQLLGATGVEDRLQEGVLQCIPRLRQANIRFWMLSGDKVETCVNISIAAGILHLDMYIAEVTTADAPGDLVLDGIWGMAQTETIIERFTKHMVESEKDRMAIKDKALIVDSRSVQAALQDEAERTFPGPFLQYALLCTSVVASRLTPMQKQEIIRLFKKKAKKVTLAVGDGANDCGMLRHADVGIGITGREGGQAMLASDYTIARFSHLQQLLLVHGRWALQRLSWLILYSFYKNVGHNLITFWFGVCCGFTATDLGSDVVSGLWNLVFTAGPIMCVAFLDRDVIYQETLVAIPEMYRDYQEGRCIGPVIFFAWVVDSFCSSLVACMFLFALNSTTSNGLTGGLTADQSVLQGLMIVLVTLRLFAFTRTWTVNNVVICSLSFTLYPIFVVAWSYLPEEFFKMLNISQDWVNISSFVWLNWTTWASLFLYLVIGFLPVTLYHLARCFAPTWTTSEQVRVWESWIVKKQKKIGRVFPGRQWARALPLLVEREMQQMEGYQPMASRAKPDEMKLMNYSGFGFAAQAGEAPQVMVYS